MKNYCASFLQKQLYGKDDFPVLTIKRTPKEKINFKLPFLQYKVIDKHPLYEPDIKILQTDSKTPKILKKAGLDFISIIDRTKGKNREVLEFKIGFAKIELNGRIRRSVPWNHLLLIDRANRRARLVGRKAKQGWVWF